MCQGKEGTDLEKAGEREVGFQEYLSILVILAACASLYWTVIPKLAKDLWDDPNFSHGLLVPFFSGYLIALGRKDLRLFPEGRGGIGLGLVTLGVLLLVVGKAGSEYFLMRSSIVFVFAGLFAIFFGEAGFRRNLFPLAFLVFMIPIPYILYDAVAFPLKMVSSFFGEKFLYVAGIPVLREGNIIHLPDIQLEVIDACSGIRSLLSLFALATVAGHFLDLRWKWALLLLLIVPPISIFTNSFRLFLTGVLSFRYGKEAAEGFFHEFSGWMVFVAAAFLVLLAGILLRKWQARGHRELQG